MRIRQAALKMYEGRTLVPTGPIRRLAKRVPGAGLAHRTLLRTLRRDTLLVTVDGLELEVSGHDQVVGLNMLLKGTWEPFGVKVFADRIRSGMHVADIGAHVGLYALTAARLVGPTGRVLAVEPDPDTARLLRANIARNGLTERVIVAECAVTDHAGDSVLYRHPTNTGAHTLLEQNLMTEAQDSLAVKVDTLDHLVESTGLQTLDVIKMDTQGAEAQVIAGGSQTLDHLPFILLEFWSDGMEAMGADPAAFLNALASRSYVFDLIEHEGRRLRRISSEELLAMPDWVDVAASPNP
jgi:FkbM family methyltransferase